MNAGPDVERLISGWLADQAPGRAPDRLVDAAVRVVERTNQRRFAAAWREPMYVTMRGLLAAALVGVVAIGGAILFLNGKPSPPVVGVSPSPGAAASAAPSQLVARPIANGRYRATIPVAGILSRLASDTTLTADEKAIVTGSVLGINGATTLHVELRISDATFTLVYNSDTGNSGAEVPWPMFALDPTTIVLDIGAAGDNIQAYFVHWTGNTFTLEPRSAAPTAVETFVRSVLYESAPFELED